jgi:hypothetical protein
MKKMMLLVGLTATVMCTGCDFSWKTASMVAEHVFDAASGIAGINNIFSLGLFPY